MKLEEIEEIWSNDCVIDETKLSYEAGSIPRLHAKYYKIYVREKMLLHKHKMDYKNLKFEKYEFLINPTEEKMNEGWKIPASGKILKNEVNNYLEGDGLLLSLELKINIQEEKVSFLKSILDSIHTRNFIISNMIKDRSFMAGEHG
jgi:Recombination, repair and ssDNA binding protein UvsY